MEADAEPDAHWDWVNASHSVLHVGHCHFMHLSDIYAYHIGKGTETRLPGVDPYLAGLHSLIHQHTMIIMDYIFDFCFPILSLLVTCPGPTVGI